MVTRNSSRIAALFLMLIAACSRPAAATSRPVSAVEVNRALNCLLREDYVIGYLKDLGLSPGSRASVRYHHGPIPGMDEGYPEVQIAVYSANQRRGWLFLANVSGRGVLTPVRNGFRLQSQHGRWDASEGNGGLETYKVMSRFVNNLARRTSVVMELSVPKGSCPSID